MTYGFRTAVPGRQAAIAAPIAAAQQRRPAPGPGAAPTRMGSTAGRPLPAAVRARMEAAFGADFSGVTVRADGTAAALGAAAFTRGERITLHPGLYDRYNLASPEGLEIIAHELAHVLQQRAGRVPGTGVTEDPALEAEAHEAGRQAVHGEPVPAAVQGEGAQVAGPGPADAGPAQLGLLGQATTPETPSRRYGRHFGQQVPTEYPETPQAQPQARPRKPRPQRSRTIVLTQVPSDEPVTEAPAPLPQPSRSPLGVRYPQTPPLVPTAPTGLLRNVPLPPRAPALAPLPSGQSLPPYSGVLPPVLGPRPKPPQSTASPQPLSPPWIRRFQPSI